MTASRQNAIPITALRMSANFSFPRVLLQYVEVNGHEVLFHTAQGTFQSWGSLKQYAEKLEPVHFGMSSRYHLANLEWVKAVTDQVVLMNDECILLSRSRKKSFMMMRTEFYGSR